MGSNRILAEFSHYETTSRKGFYPMAGIISTRLIAWLAYKTSKGMGIDLPVMQPNYAN